MQVSLPDAARMIVGRNFVPAGVAQESIFDSRRTAMLELIALNTVATAGKRNEAFARRCPRMPCAQGFADAHPVQLVRKQPGQTAFRAEHRGAGYAAAAAAAMLVTGCGRPELVATTHRLFVKPAEMPPARADLDQPLELRIVPIEIATPAANMRNQQVPFRLVRIGEPQLLQRPGAGHDLVAALHVLVPFERAHMRSVFEEWELRGLAMEEDDV